MLRRTQSTEYQRIERLSRLEATDVPNHPDLRYVLPRGRTRGLRSVHGLLQDIIDPPLEDADPFPLDPDNFNVVVDILSQNRAWVFLCFRSTTHVIRDHDGNLRCASSPLEPIKVFLGWDRGHSDDDDYRNALTKLISLEPRQLVDISPTPLTWLLTQNEFEHLHEAYSGEITDMVPWIAQQKPQALRIPYQGNLPIHSLIIDFFSDYKVCYLNWVELFVDLEPRCLFQKCFFPSSHPKSAFSGSTPLNTAILLLGRMEMLHEVRTVGVQDTSESSQDLTFIHSLRDVVDYLNRRSCNEASDLGDLICLLAPDDIAPYNTTIQRYPWEEARFSPWHVGHYTVNRNFRVLHGTLSLGWYY